jgi:hypothetical protein
MLGRRIAALLVRSGYDVAGPARSIHLAKQAVGIDGVDGAVLDTSDSHENSRSLAAEIARQGAAVLLVSDDSDWSESFERQHVLHLRKPFTDEQLLTQVRALFASGGLSFGERCPKVARS